MKKEIIIAGLIGIAAGVFLVAPLLNANRPFYGMTGYRNMMGGNRGADAHFIEQMIPHHESAISMAEIAIVKAEHPEIKALAESIKASQSAENEKMRAWYRQWFGEDVPEYGGHHMSAGSGMMGMNSVMTGGLDDLTKAKPFDKEFMEQMIPHHEMAVMMANMIRSSERLEMRRLAADIAAAQNKEITEMQNWYESWYVNQ